MKNLFNGTRSQTFLVLGGDQDIKASATAGAKVALNDFANDAVNLADKQLGVVVNKHTDTALEKHFLVKGETISTVKNISLVQGTPNSASVSSVNANRMGDLAYVASNPIDLSQDIKVVSYGAKQSYSSAWVIGDVAANAGAIVPVDNVVYKLKIAFGGRHQQKQYATSGTNRMFINLTKEATSYTNDVDRFIQVAASKLNALSSHQGRKRSSGRAAGNKPALVLGINIGGGAGASLTDLTNTANIGTKYNYEIKNGVTYQFTLTADLVQTLTNVVANISNITTATTVEVMNLATAGSNAMGAGADAVDALLVLALDMKPALIDDRMETYKTTITQIGMEGFAANVRREVASRAYRGFGYGYQLYNMYLSRAQQEIIGGETFPLENRPMSPIPAYMAKDNTLYDVHEIWSQDVQLAGNTDFDRRSQTIILVPVGDTTTTAGLNDELQTLLDSCPSVEVFSEATGGALFA